MLGLELLQRFGRQLEQVSGFVLIAFGVAYGAWGLHRAVRARWHAHGHGHTHWHTGGGHGHHHDEPRRMTAWMPAITGPNTRTTSSVGAESRRAASSGRPMARVLGRTSA